MMISCFMFRYMMIIQFNSIQFYLYSAITIQLSLGALQSPKPEPPGNRGKKKLPVVLNLYPSVCFAEIYYELLLVSYFRYYYYLKTEGGRRLSKMLRSRSLF